MNLYAAGITDLDNVRPEPYQRLLTWFPARLDVPADVVHDALLKEAAAASPYGYASPTSCNVVAARWLAELMAARIHVA